VPGSAQTNQVIIVPDPSKANGLFRMVYP
jgi:hypothetical protein